MKKTTARKEISPRNIQMRMKDHNIGTSNCGENNLTPTISSKQKINETQQQQVIVTKPRQSIKQNGKIKTPNSVIAHFETKPKRAIQTREGEIPPFKRQVIKEQCKSGVRSGIQTQQSTESLQSSMILGQKFLKWQDGNVHSHSKMKKLNQLVYEPNESNDKNNQKIKRKQSPL